MPPSSQTLAEGSMAFASRAMWPPSHLAIATNRCFRSELDSLLIVGLAISDATIQPNTCRGQHGFRFSRDVASFPSGNSDKSLLPEAPDLDLEAFSLRLSSHREAGRDAQPGDDLASPKNRSGARMPQPLVDPVFFHVQ